MKTLRLDPQNRPCRTSRIQRAGGTGGIEQIFIKRSSGSLYERGARAEIQEAKFGCSRSLAVMIRSPPPLSGHLIPKAGAFHLTPPARHELFAGRASCPMPEALRGEAENFSLPTTTDCVKSTLHFVKRKPEHNLLKFYPQIFVPLRCGLRSGAASLQHPGVSFIEVILRLT